MDSNSATVFEVFETQCHFRVPLFQRQYCWSREKQWEYLWQDIEDQATRFAHHDAAAAPHPPGSDHFLGAIVTQMVSNSSTLDVPTRNVIDGQQRLTTLQLVLAAYRDFVQSHCENEHASILKKLRILTENGTAPERNLQWYKIGPTSADCPTSEAILSCDISRPTDIDVPPKDREYESLLLHAYYYFYGEICNYCVESRPNNTTLINGAKVIALMQAFQSGLRLVHIELNDDDNPQGVFESLNARGEPLLVSDLIRNHIFNSRALKNQGLDRIYDKYWRDFDHKKAHRKISGESHFWKQSIKQGRMLAPRLDLYMFHFIQSKSKREVRAGGLFKRFQKWWGDAASNQVSERDLLDIIKQQSELFAALSTPNQHREHDIFQRNSRYWTFAERIADIDVGTLYPLILELFDPNHADTLHLELPHILDYLESYVVRRMVCGLSSNNYNQFFHSLLNLVQHSDTVTHCEVHEFLHRPSSSTSVSTYWPSDKEFRQHWCDQPLFKKLKSQRSAVLLRALNDQLVGDAAEHPRDKKVTVEHVLPRGWMKMDVDTGWSPQMSHPLSDEDTAFVNRRNLLLNSIGNLTLMEGKWNIRASNKAFCDKRLEYKNSQLLLNRYFDDKCEWNESHIAERANQLFDLALKVWPHPDSPTGRL